MSWLFNCLAVWRAGGQAIRITSKSERQNFDLDGLIIGGGDDINAEIYGGKIQINVRVDEERDQLEQRLLAEGMEKKIPILGICRGAQMINIHLGGNLHTDIYEVYENAPKMRTVLPKKSVDIKLRSFLHEIMGSRRHMINCLHHQSIDRLGHGLEVVARDDYDIIQAVEFSDYPFLIGVQWHPEYLPQSPKHQRLFRILVKKAQSSNVFPD